MKVRYKTGSIYGPGLTDFPYKEDDYVTIVIRYWNSKEEDDDLYYHAHIKGFDHLRDGFWARLDDHPKIEQFFYFGDIEAVLDGDRIPFLGGSTKRIKKGV